MDHSHKIFRGIRLAGDDSISAPWHQLFQFVIWHSFMRTVIKKKHEVLINVQAIGLGCFDNRIDCCAGLSTADRITEHPILAAYGTQSNGLFGCLCECSDKHPSEPSGLSQLGERTGSSLIPSREHSPARSSIQLWRQQS